jgi:hypothetical protein
MKAWLENLKKGVNPLLQLRVSSTARLCLISQEYEES